MVGSPFLRREEKQQKILSQNTRNFDLTDRSKLVANFLASGIDLYFNWTAKSLIVYLVLDVL